MRLFLDSAKLTDIKECLDLGIVSGVTINQSLLAKEKNRGLAWHYREASEIVRAPASLSLPVVATDPAEMVIEGCRCWKLFSKQSDLAIKVPVSWQTLPVISELHQAGVRVNATCIFTHYQAIMAAMAGATYLSVFVGRINDKLPSNLKGPQSFAPETCSEYMGGYAVIREAKRLGKIIIAGSIRDPLMARMAWDAGADIVTTSRKVIEQMANDEDSQKSADKFNEDYATWIK